MDIATPPAVGAGLRTGFAAALVIGSAGLYTLTMVVMKVWGQHHPTILAAILGVALVGAVWLEILALRQERLGMVYVAILGAECLMVVAASHFLFGEQFTLREAVGGGIIALGVAVAWA